MTELAERTLIKTSENLSSAPNYSKHQKDPLSNDAGFHDEVTLPVPFVSQNRVSSLDESTAVLLAQDDPGQKAVQILFSEFIRIYISHSSDAQIWDEVLAYEEACIQQIENLSKMIVKVPFHQSCFSKSNNMLVKLIGERNLWRLLRSLFQLRHNEDSFGEADFPIVSVIKNYSDETIAAQLYKSNPYVREAQNVIDWLEKNARDDFKYTKYNPIDQFGEIHVAWENTLKSRKTTASDDSYQYTNRRIVTSLDPDSTIRQERNLHELDEEDDHRLLRGVFTYLRAGQLVEAQELCAKSGQHWRASTFEGWKLFHDSNNSDQKERPPVSGNRYRDVWKSIAWKAASDSRLNADERAVYGALCGHLPAMLLVCKKWEDQVWAYFRTLVDQHVEETLRETSLPLRSFQPLPKDYPEEKLTVEGIFQEVESRIGSGNLTFYHQLQKFLILGDIAALLTVSHQLLLHSDLSSHSLRCLTHLVLVLKRLGSVPFELENLVTEIVCACTKEAVERGDIEQVAHYCAVLPESLQIRLYSDFLMNIHEAHHRKHSLSMAVSVGLNAEAITSTVVTKIRLSKSHDFSNEISAEASAADQAKIDAMDWVLFDRAQMPDALCHANAILRDFLISNKVSSAKSLMKKMPSDFIDVIIKLHKSKEGNTDLPPYYENRVREYLCFKALLDAQDSFTDWFNHFHQKKPPTPPVLAQNSSFQQQLAHEHLLQQYNADLDKWKQTLQLITKKATERLYNVLLFPDGGWMNDATSAPPPFVNDDDSSLSSPTKDDVFSTPDEKKSLQYLGPELYRREPNREHQMTILRSIYIPQITSLLQNVLHSAQKYKELIQLSDLIASEQHNLYKCFSSGEMQRFLYKLQETCRIVLDNNLDAFGYQS